MSPTVLVLRLATVFALVMLTKKKPTAPKHDADDID